MALISTRMPDLPQSERFNLKPLCLCRHYYLKPDLNKAIDRLLSLKRHTHELLQDPPSIHYLTATIIRDLYGCSDALSNEGRDDRPPRTSYRRPDTTHTLVLSPILPSWGCSAYNPGVHHSTRPRPSPGSIFRVSSKRRRSFGPDTGSRHAQ